MGTLLSVPDLEMLHSTQTAGYQAVVAVAAAAVIPSGRHSVVHLTPQNILDRRILRFRRDSPMSRITLPRCPRGNMCSTSWSHIEGSPRPDQPIHSVPLPHRMIGDRLRDIWATRTDLNSCATGTTTYRATIRVAMDCLTAKRHMRILRSNGIPHITAGCLKLTHMVRAAQAEVIRLDGQTERAVQ